MENHNPKELLISTLKQFDIEIISNEGKMVNMEKDYTVEIEGKNLFKLLQGGQVVAPFADVGELCKFIKMDMELNEES